MTIKHRIGTYIIPRLPFNKHFFNHFRLELNAFFVRNIVCLNPVYWGKLKKLRNQQNLLVNVGCGPFGKEGWVNLDLYPHPGLTLRYDARWSLPFSDNSCKGIHVEHFLEHLNHEDEVPAFLYECKRCLDRNGILRIIVPDAGLYIKGYVEDGWDLFNKITCGGDVPEQQFETKMQALNHVFIQNWEHYGGYDSETLKHILNETGFKNIRKCNWREGNFPGGCIDREHHKKYSLYYEASK